MEIPLSEKQNSIFCRTHLIHERSHSINGRLSKRRAVYKEPELLRVLNIRGPFEKFVIIPSRNYVEVQCRSLFRSTSLDKLCTSYNAPPTSRKRAADRLPHASGG
jgi:hypothetical protein